MKIEICFPHTKTCYRDACTIIETDRNFHIQDVTDEAKAKIQNESELCFSEYNGYRSEPTSVKELV